MYFVLVLVVEKEKAEKEKSLKMRTVFLPSKFKVVEGYFSYLSPAQKQMYAMQSIEHIANRANSLTPIAASITGSALRGNDRLDSDVDILVIVLEKVRSREFSFIDDNGVEIDGKIESLNNFMQKLPTSVPYMEFAFSPFRQTDSRFYALFNSLALSNINSYVFTVHADAFEEHATMRAAKSGEEKKMIKARQMSLAKDYLLENKSSTVPRELFEQ